MFKLRDEITCNTCFNGSSNEAYSSLLQLAMTNSIQTDLNFSLQAELLTGDNSVYCNFCCSLKSSVFCIFVSHDNQFIEDIKQVQCTPNMFVAVKDNEVGFQKDYHLIATINHTGNLNRVHYTSFIKVPNSKSWLHCNNAAALRADENNVNNTSSYTYF